MNSEEILASITAHYMAADRLTTSQLQEHKRRGGCLACDRGMPVPERVTAKERQDTVRGKVAR